MHVLGIARTDGRVLREAETLAAAGMQVSIVDVEEDRDRPRTEMVGALWLEHIAMPSWFVPVRFKPWFLVKAAQVLLHGVGRLLRTDADIYHAHDITALPAAYIAARLRRKPLIFDAHELPLVEPNIVRWRRLSRLAQVCLRAMLPRCDAVITVSPPIAKEITRLYGGRPPVVIRNVPAYQPPRESDRLRLALGLGPDVRIALYQGNLQTDRGLDLLVRAGQHLDPHARIVLMGRGAARDELAALIVRLGVADRVILLPAAPYAELLDWTASADLGLIVYPPGYSPNVRMCLPNKLFEYLMAGIPILASPLPAVRAISETYDAGAIVPDLSPESVGQSINALLADPVALARMRANARAAAAHDLRWDVESQRLLACYAEMRR